MPSHVLDGAIRQRVNGSPSILGALMGDEPPMGFGRTFAAGSPMGPCSSVGRRPPRARRALRVQRCAVRAVAERDLEPCRAMILWSFGSNRSAFRTPQVAQDGVQARKTECRDAGQAVLPQVSPGVIRRRQFQ